MKEKLKAQMLERRLEVARRYILLNFIQFNLSR